MIFGVTKLRCLTIKLKTQQRQTSVLHVSYGTAFLDKITDKVYQTN